MKIFLTAISVLALSTSPAFAQEQPAAPAPKCETMPDGKMKCCKKGENDEMVCQMMDHSGSGHAEMDHGDMDHSNMSHGDMNHAEMDQSETSEGEVDHSQMDHSAMTERQPETAGDHSDHSQHQEPKPE